MAASIKISELNSLTNLTDVDLFLYDTDIAVREIQKFLIDCDERHFDNLFLSLQSLDDEYYSEVKKLVLDHTLQLNIPYTAASPQN